jgi:hypothetical protein
MNTRLEAISGYMAATSPIYRSAWVGLKVMHTTPSGQRLLGTIAGWANNQPVAVFADGSKACLRRKVEIVP